MGELPSNMEFRGLAPKNEESPFLKRMARARTIKAQLTRAITKSFRPKPDQKAIRAREAQQL